MLTLDTKSDKDNWLNEQEDLVSEIQGMGILFDDFRWNINITTYEYQDGTIEPAINIQGKTTVLCVLE